MVTEPTIHLRPGHVQPVWTGHPWVYAQAIARIEGAPSAGDVVAVRDPKGKLLGRGYWSPGSAIPVRLLSRDDGVIPQGDWLTDRIATAAAWRREILGLPSDETNGYRLVNAEGDGLPGLVVDVFGRAAAVQFLTAGMKRRESAVLDAVLAATGVTSVLEVASPRYQAIEGFTVSPGVVRGPPVGEFTFRERGMDLAVAAPGETGGGQKTGYYFDQRDNRAMVEGLSAGRRVMDAFAFVGGFALSAARGGAREVVAVDSSAPAVLTGERNTARAGMASTVRWQRGDVRGVLAEVTSDDRYDLVVLDPPKLARNAREVADACGHYRRLNALAVRALRPNGLLVTCSCSGAVGTEDFLRAVASGARDAGRDAMVLRVQGAAGDHPSPAAFTDGRYLKCVLARVP